MMLGFTTWTLLQTNSNIDDAIAFLKHSDFQLVAPRMAVDEKVLLHMLSS